MATFSGLNLDQAGVLFTDRDRQRPASVNHESLHRQSVGSKRSSWSWARPSMSLPVRLLISMSWPTTLGNVDPTFNGSVTLALANNPGGATLGGTLTVTAVNGVAIFTGLTINNLGSGYTLEATSATGLTAGDSVPFDVTTAISWSSRPNRQPRLTAGSSFGFVVTAEDNAGNVDTSFNGSVTVALVNLGSNTATLGGTLTVTASTAWPPSPA